MPVVPYSNLSRVSAMLTTGFRHFSHDFRSKFPLKFLPKTGYGLEDRVSVPGRGREFSFHLRFHVGFGAHPTSYQMGAGPIYPGLKRSECEVGHSGLSVADVKNACSFTFAPPYIFTAWWLNSGASLSHEEFCLQGYRNRIALRATCFHAGFLLGLFFDPEDGCDMLLRNFGWLSAHYTAVYPRRQNSSYPPLWEPQILHNVISYPTIHNYLSNFRSISSVVEGALLYTSIIDNKATDL
jgi:hypothetical protein